ncbi:Werner Syndrome-like exonuclease [Neltuma alba]|uniref:Werner Syndrome-like exonuclease n=1 Tax=Neltuma alba TaxID=207710 RepID=UPI0010A36009|nr:Werner Syndrome-like exonuclease [Prosopis alba]
MSDTVIYNPSTSKYYVISQGSTIETTLTHKASVADEWLRQVYSKYGGRHTVVGLDTEWMLREVSLTMKAAILQLCVENTCLILQLFCLDDVPENLRKFLTDSNFTFVGVQVKNDIKKLRKEYGIECSNGVDVLEVAKREWPEKFSRSGLKHLAKELVGLEMKKNKKVTMSEWHVRDLSYEQVEYACIDAYASYWIGHKLLVEDKLTS